MCPRLYTGRHWRELGGAGVGLYDLCSSLNEPVSVGILALLFGLPHSSIYRLSPTLVLGLVLGYAVVKTGSIACGIIIHALNNGFAMTMTRSKSLVEALGLDNGAMLPWDFTLIGSGVLLAGLWLFKSLPEPAD